MEGKPDHAKTSRPHYGDTPEDSNQILEETGEAKDLNRSMDDVDLGEERKQSEELSYGSEDDDDIDSDYFAASRAKNNTSYGLNSARRSNLSNGSSTFRDTELTEVDALKTMRIQSLTSIVNNPEKKSLIKKIESMVKNNTIGKKHMHRKAQKKYVYKP